MPQQIALFEYRENGQIQRVVPLGGGIRWRVGKIQLSHTVEEIISLENLCLAWQEFVVGKKAKKDVRIFSRHLMNNIVSLHHDLANKTYQHGSYESFYITDPKPRHIHKASVRDRLLHHALHRVLYPFFNRTFIYDSYSCRVDKGLHKAINRFRQTANQVSHNDTKTCWILKCDIRKFFPSIDHRILLQILQEYIFDKDIIWLLGQIIGSFSTVNNPGVGLPLGNLTSQLFANVFMNVFDQWAKHRLKARYYLRYADDFIFLSRDKMWLENIRQQIRQFLSEKLKLILHPDKIFLKTCASGVDFLGWVGFPRHRVLRKSTKQRMFVKMKVSPSLETLQSYLGLLSHGNTAKARQELLWQYWLWE